MRADQAVGSGRSSRSRALGAEELLVGGGGEVDGQGALHVAVRPSRASLASRERRTASSSEMGGGRGRPAARRAGRRRSRRRLVGGRST